jgi:hypothetical protein
MMMTMMNERLLRIVDRVSKIIVLRNSCIIEKKIKMNREKKETHIHKYIHN